MRHMNEREKKISEIYNKAEQKAKDAARDFLADKIWYDELKRILCAIDRNAVKAADRIMKKESD